MCRSNFAGPVRPAIRAENPSGRVATEISRVNVMNAENEKLIRAQAEEQHEPTLRDIQAQLARLEERLERDSR